MVPNRATHHILMVFNAKFVNCSGNVSSKFNYAMIGSFGTVSWVTMEQSAEKLWSKFSFNKFAEKSPCFFLGSFYFSIFMKIDKFKNWHIDRLTYWQILLANFKYWTFSEQYSSFKWKEIFTSLHENTKVSSPFYHKKYFW